MTKHWEEKLYSDCAQKVTTHQIPFSFRSKFQNIEIIDTSRFGRLMALDGIVQTTLSDEFVYHEMLVAPGMAMSNNPSVIAIVGGGDGGALREVLKWRDVESVDLIEIDEAVIQVAKEWLPSISRGSFENEKTRIIIADAVDFIKKQIDHYDVIIVDSSDPVGASAELFGHEFYKNAYRALRSGGVIVTQCGCPAMAPVQLVKSHRFLSGLFSWCQPYLTAVPSFYGGYFCFVVAGKRRPDVSWESKLDIYSESAIWITTEYIKSTFQLPKAIKEQLQPGELYD